MPSETLFGGQSQTHLEPAVVARARLDQALVIDPVQKARTRATCKALNGASFRGLVRAGALSERGVDAAAIQARRRGDVVRALEAALDLERAHAELDQTRYGGARFQILRREQVGALAELPQHVVDHELVRKAAGLGTSATVGAAAADGLTGQTLPRVRHAQRAVDEHL